MIGGTQFQDALDLCNGIVAVEQRNLRLLDWDIRVRIGSPVPDTGTTIAQINWDFTSMVATITIPPEHDERVADALLVREGETPVDCLRKSLRHELLHLYAAPYRNSLTNALKDEDDARDAFQKYEEGWIERVTRTLEDLEAA